MTFKLHPIRFAFSVRHAIDLTSGTAANTIRGSWGAALKRLACPANCVSTSACEQPQQCPYARIFEPSATNVGPSGLANLPRPFVLRAAHLDGHRFTPGQTFSIDLHLFNTRDPMLSDVVCGMKEMWRGRADLLSAASIADATSPIYKQEEGVVRLPSPMVLDLEPDPIQTTRAIVQFKTSTELKTAEGLAEKPDFAVLFARIRDRLSILRRAYGAGPLAIDYRAMGERATRVRMIGCALRRVEAERRSSRTGQTHSLGGFTGEAEYEGELDEFLPYLRAAKWTGVGRQTVWGKGEIEVFT